MLLLLLMVRGARTGQGRCDSVTIDRREESTVEQGRGCMRAATEVLVLYVLGRL